MDDWVEVTFIMQFDGVVDQTKEQRKLLSNELRVNSGGKIPIVIKIAD